MGKHILIALGLLIWAQGNFFWGYYVGKENSPKPRAYQIELNDSSTIIYDGDRRVGTIPFDSCSQFDRLMLKDNE